MRIDFLPDRVKEAIELCDMSEFYEIRFRVGYPIILKSFGRNFYLGERGKTILRESAYICTENDIEEVIENATERSIYAYNEEIRQGFITVAGGIRIGLCGNCVYEEDKLVTIKDFTSLNIRIPHEVKGCSSKICEWLFSEKPFSTLIVSPPAKGKTTILKDIARKLNIKYKSSLLIIDERGEFSDVNGENIDKICYSDKLFAFNYALRSMAPEIVITDELCGERDWECAENAVNCGVKIFASMHGDDIRSLYNNKFFKRGVFERYIAINALENSGIKFKIYNKELKEL